MKVFPYPRETVFTSFQLKNHQNMLFVKGGQTFWIHLYTFLLLLLLSWQNISLSIEVKLCFPLSILSFADMNTGEIMTLH